MRIDLHCHTSRYSSDSSLDPDELLGLARAAGLDGICLTEHDRLWPQADVRRLAAAHGIVVLRGMEVTTEHVHVLVFGVDAPPPAMFVASALATAVRAAGGLTALAHPARPGQPHIARDLIAALFDTVEVLAGSDCHAPAEVGTVATVLPHRVEHERDLVEALSLGRHRVERLPAPPRPETRGHV